MGHLALIVVRKTGDFGLGVGFADLAPSGRIIAEAGAMVGRVFDPLHLAQAVVMGGDGAGARVGDRGAAAEAVIAKGGGHAALGAAGGQQSAHGHALGVDGSVRVVDGFGRVGAIQRLTCVTVRVTLYYMIKSFKHKGLKQLFEKGSKQGVNPEHTARLRLILARLDASSTQEDMNLPGLGLHPLKGSLKGFWAVRVSGNWRVIFRFESGDAIDVDYLDYH